VDQSLTRSLEKVGEDTPAIPEIMKAYMLNFRPKFNFLQLRFFGGTPVPVGGALGSLGQYLTRLKI